MTTAGSLIPIIHRYYPDFVINTPRLLTESGQFNHVLCVDDRWIFRFPKSEHVAREVAHEVDVLKRLQGKLPLPIPDPTFVGIHPEKGLLEFMGYAMLDGTPLLRDKFATLTDTTIRDQIAQDIANFLHTLHHILPSDIGLDDKMRDSRQEWQDLYEDFKTLLFPHMKPSARQEVTSNVTQALADDRLWDIKPRLIHGDFGTGNILYSHGQIVGIIDFTFCMVGDPAQDVGAILSSYGEAFLKQVIKYYPDLESALRRANFYRSNYALLEALYGLRDNDLTSFENGIEDYR